MASPLTILLTGAGAPGVTGTVHALRHNPSGEAVHLIGTDMRPDAVGRSLVDEYSIVPSPEDPGYEATVQDICQRCAVDLVLPQTTREVERLAELKQPFAELGVGVIAGDPQAVRRGNDKSATLAAFASADLPTPDWAIARSREEVDTLVRDLGYPGSEVVVKLPRGNGMRGFRILSADAGGYHAFATSKPGDARVTLEEFGAVLDEADDIELIVTEFLPGPEYSVDCYLGPSGEVAVVRERIAVRSGIAFDTMVVDRPDIAEMALRGARSLGLDGVFGFQFKDRADGTPLLLECNPRVQGTMIASVLAGANVIWMAVNDALDRPAMAVPNIRFGSRFQRYWGGVDDLGAHVPGAL